MQTHGARWWKIWWLTSAETAGREKNKKRRYLSGIFSSAHRISEPMDLKALTRKHPNGVFAIGGTRCQWPRTEKT
mgnify:CR=1 FL=1